MESSRTFKLVLSESFLAADKLTIGVPNPPEYRHGVVISDISLVFKILKIRGHKRVLHRGYEYKAKLI